MLKLRPLFSGSTGNCTLIEGGQTRLLVDCGISGKRIEQALAAIDVDPTSITALLLTHEHSDHIQSVGVLHRRYGFPVYINRATWQAVQPTIGRYQEDAISLFDASFCVQDVEVQPFSIPHDAADPVGYTFFYQGQKGSIATDIGVASEELIAQLAGSETVLLEANHDVEMLKAGPYPYSLKQRILSNRGHLSNDSAAQICCRLVKANTRHIILGHLSRYNNLPALAYQTVCTELQSIGAQVGSDLTLTVAGEAGVC